MKKASFTISIPTPCHESWETMTPTEQGRFCLNCQKIVTDFFAMSDQEIISFFSNRQDYICGRFHPTQLNRELQQPVAIKRSRKHFAAIISLITALTIAIPSARAQRKIGKIQVAPDKKSQSDTKITDADSTYPRRMEISPLGVNKKYLPKKIDASLNNNSQPAPSLPSGIMGGVVPGINISEIRGSSSKTIKTSIFDFF